MTLRKDPEGIETAHLRDFAPLTGARVLEVGCGDGRLTWRYAEAARRVTGIDPDAEELAIASCECPPHLCSRVTLTQAQAGALPFPRESFDVAVLAWSL
jgi:ubiquinone/menaquinone biosynthesis C-methylase UbiE